MLTQSNELLEDLIEEHKKFLNREKNAKKQNLIGVKKRLSSIKDDKKISKKVRDAEAILLEKEIIRLEKAYKEVVFTLNIWKDQYVKLRTYLKTDYKDMPFSDNEEFDA